MKCKYIINKVIIALLLFSSLHKNVVAEASLPVYCEQISAGLRIPLVCAQTFLENQNLSTNRKNRLVTVFASLARLTNAIFQEVNNGNIHSALTSIYTPWIMYDATQLLTSTLEALGSNRNVNEIINEISADNSEIQDNPSNHSDKIKTIVQQVFALTEGVSALVASFSSGQQYTKNIRYTCYSLSSLSRLGAMILTQNTCISKQALGILFILNATVLIYNLLNDYDAIDRQLDNLVHARLNNFFELFGLGELTEENHTDRGNTARQAPERNTRGSEATIGNATLEDAGIRINFPDGRPAIERSDRCTICLDTFIHGIEVTRTSCNHFFCRVCLQQWRNLIPNYTDGSPRPHPCPECRTNLNTGQNTTVNL